MSNLLPRLAINGASPVRTQAFRRYNTIGPDERSAVMAVLESGRLSGFYGSYDEGFLGGEQVRHLEDEWAVHFGSDNAVAVNSATSGLIAAVGAAGIGPGDEVIVTPISMSATATAIVVWGGIPVFADIEPEYFCLDPESVRRAITPRTRAIVVTDLFGLPYDRVGINAIAAEHGLLVIEDNAQGPGAVLDERLAGTLGDIGIFSLNYHKHIHTGEGGIACTDDDRLADRMRMIRNHAEAVAGGRIADEPDMDLVNMVGFNFRLGEMEAAIARSQLTRLDGLVGRGVSNVRYLEAGLSEVPCLTMPKLRPGASHSYYLHSMLFDESVAGIPRETYVEAVAAELAVTEGRESDGPLVFAGYGVPLYTLPMYSKKIAFGSGGYPFSRSDRATDEMYRPGLCPVAEDVLDRIIVHELFRPPASQDDLDDVIEAFTKVWENRSELMN